MANIARIATAIRIGALFTYQSEHNLFRWHTENNRLECAYGFEDLDEAVDNAIAEIELDRQRRQAQSDQSIEETL